MIYLSQPNAGFITKTSQLFSGRVKDNNKSYITNVKLDMKMIDAHSRRLHLPARILPNPLLYVRPSFGSVIITYVSNEAGCVPEAWEQGRLFCKVGFCVLALCALQMCLTWCVGCLYNAKIT